MNFSPFNPALETNGTSDITPAVLSLGTIMGQNTTQNTSSHAAPGLAWCSNLPFGSSGVVLHLILVHFSFMNCVVHLSCIPSLGLSTTNVARTLGALSSLATFFVPFFSNNFVNCGDPLV
jgi:hypothetical protein